MTILQAAILSLITGLVGAVFGHLLSVRKSRRDELAGMELCAYSDFLKAISNLVSCRHIGRIDNDPSDLAVLNDAKIRICVCASSAVVEALENFWLQGGTLEREREIIAFTKLCRAMRESLGNNQLSYEVKLSDILFKLEPSTYSHKAEKKNE